MLAVMCTLVTAHGVLDSFPLIIAANRDERYDRPSARAQFWPDASHVLAGRDLKAGGTWLGITRSGRWAAVTNVYEKAHDASRPRSRGDLVSDFLLGDKAPQPYLEAIRADGDQYRAFNVIVGDGPEVWYLSNYNDALQPLSPGIHGVSNHLLNTPWPKLERAKRGVRAACDTYRRPGDEPALLDALHELLSDPTEATDAELQAPDLPRARQRPLSALFVRDGDYGTCSSTAIVMNSAGDIHFEERVTNPLVRGEERERRATFVFGPDGTASVP
ncbi:MAG: NRDE family protein [Haliangiales bacterium]